MKLLSAVFAVAAVLSASDPAVAPHPAVAPRPAVAQQVTIPKGAVEVEPGTFHDTDAQGKKWIYRQTPFGVARFEDAALPPESQGGKPGPAQDLYAGAKATADGDTIRFERPGPFGVYKWEKNKSELDEMEQAVWNRQLAKTAAK